MTSKEYLRQAYRLDQKINSDIAEASRLQEIAYGVSTPKFTERVQTSPSGDAPFAHQIEKLMALKETINHEVDLYVDLKEQMRTVISAVPDANEQMVLRYRYIHNLTWEQIGNKLEADPRTVRRWHSSALAHVNLPEDPIEI